MAEDKRDPHDREKAKLDNYKYYDEWVQNGRYDEDVNREHYNGPQTCADGLLRHLGTKLDSRILDVGAGTGFLGMELRDLGFTNVDGLEPVGRMLAVARERGVYVNHLVGGFSAKPTSIGQSTYDAIGTSGCLSAGHVPCSGLDEMVRVVKPEGFVVIAMYEPALWEKDNFGETFSTKMKTLEETGQWKQLEKVAIPGYYYDVKGILIVFKITKTE